MQIPASHTLLSPICQVSSICQVIGIIQEQLFPDNLTFIDEIHIPMSRRQFHELRIYCLTCIFNRFVHSALIADIDSFPSAECIVCQHRIHLSTTARTGELLPFSLCLIPSLNSCFHVNHPYSVSLKILYICCRTDTVRYPVPHDCAVSVPGELCTHFRSTLIVQIST